MGRAGEGSEVRMELKVYDTVDETAAASARWLAAALRAAVQARDTANLALSGGRTPWRMLETLVADDLPWPQLQVFQIDERAVPEGDNRRNDRRIAQYLVSADRLSAEKFHAMLDDGSVLDSAAARYSAILSAYLGQPPVLDVVQLGLGADGHTASLIPDDPLLAVTDRTVGLSNLYEGTRRLTLTFPVLNAARMRLWLVTGNDKIDALRALMAGDEHLPCGRVRRDCTVIFADSAAASKLQF
jgi:6-phosphogluconolactonase/glucosamine-6-phosphate isomerase/deaminase